MSLIPDNFVLQYSSNAGDIAHQGVLGSNISRSTILTSTFPTTSTSDSLGHYHYTEPTTNALQFLNASGSGIGGHKFYTSNSTTEPVNTASIGLDGLTIDRSTAGLPILLNLPDLTQSTDVVVVFATPINQPPWNITGTGNPVQVSQNTANMQTGTTYYLSAFSNQLGQLTTNQDGTGVIDTTDLITFPQPILAWESGQFSPSTIQTINMLDGLTITTDVDSSILSATDLTFNGVSYAQNQVVPTLIFSSPLIYADGIQPANGLAIRNTYGYSGWYFKNILPTNKINWYFPAQTRTSTTVANLKGIAISFFNGQTVSNDNTLFITVYTNLTGTNDYAPSFFHSSMTYVFNQAITPIANTNYQGVCIIDKDLVPFNFETQIQFEPSTINNPRGTYSQNDTILAVVIGTNSASAQNSVELVVNKLNLIYSNFTQSYLLVPP